MDISLRFRIISFVSVLLIYLYVYIFFPGKYIILYYLPTIFLLSIGGFVLIYVKYTEILREFDKLVLENLDKEK